MLDKARSHALRWSERIEKGALAEQIIIPEFVNAGWSVLPFGLARENSPVPYLRTSNGRVRPADFATWSPDGRRMWVIECKSKFELDLGGYGLDTDKVAGTDEWEAIKKHNQRGGPVAVVIWDEKKRKALAASVNMLSTPGPNLSKNQRLWWWKTKTFLPLDAFLRIGG